MHWLVTSKNVCKLAPFNLAHPVDVFINYCIKACYAQFIQHSSNATLYFAVNYLLNYCVSSE